MSAEVRAESQQTHTAHDNTGRQTGDAQTDSAHTRGRGRVYRTGSRRNNAITYKNEKPNQKLNHGRRSGMREQQWGEIEGGGNRERESKESAPLPPSPTLPHVVIGRSSGENLPDLSCLMRPLLLVVLTGRKSLNQEMSGSGLPLAAHSMVAVRVRSTTFSCGPMSMVGKPGGSWSSGDGDTWQRRYPTGCWNSWTE